MTDDLNHSCLGWLRALVVFMRLISQHTVFAPTKWLHYTVITMNTPSQQYTRPHPQAAWSNLQLHPDKLSLKHYVITSKPLVSVIYWYFIIYSSTLRCTLDMFNSWMVEKKHRYDVGFRILIDICSNCSNSNANHFHISSNTTDMAIHWRHVPCNCWRHWYCSIGSCVDTDA